MKKILMVAIAGSAMMLTGCGEKAEEAAPAVETSAEAATSEAASSDAGADAGTATDAGDETTSGGVQPAPKS